MRLLSLVFMAAAISRGGWLSVHSAEPKTGATIDDAAPEKQPDEQPPEDAVKEIVSGKVVMLVDALKLRGVKTYAEEIKDQVVLVTADKELIPIVPDWRGRA